MFWQPPPMSLFSAQFSKMMNCVTISAVSRLQPLSMQSFVFQQGRSTLLSIWNKGWQMNSARCRRGPTFQLVVLAMFVHIRKRQRTLHWRGTPVQAVVSNFSGTNALCMGRVVIWPCPGPFLYIWDIKVIALPDRTCNTSVLFLILLLMRMLHFL